MMFDRIVCGVDPGPEASWPRTSGAGWRLRTVLILVGIIETDVAVHAGWAAGQVLDRLKDDGTEALHRVGQEESTTPSRPACSRLSGAALSRPPSRGAPRSPWSGRGHSRRGGIILGSLSTTALHEAPCSVLVARPDEGSGQFPSRIVVGTDGSNEAEAAYAIAAALRDRFGATLELVTSSAGKAVGLDAVQASHPDVVMDERKPLECLVARSQDADLLVIGSRGLHGLKSLGSISERVAHDARCSVLLVVR
jgi:nucleotide-binding universal stress UspA family protein